MSRTTGNSRFAFALIAGALLAVPAAAQEVVLKAASNLPTNVINVRHFVEYVEKVNKAGQGKIRIQMLGGPEVIPTNNQGNALKTGVIDVNFGIAAFYKSAVPHGDAMIAATIDAVKSREQGHTDYLDKIWQQRINGHLLGWFDSGIGWHVYLINEPKRTPSGGVDFSGIKVRTSGSTREFVQAIGAIPAVVHANETYTALERGVVQGNVFPSAGLIDYGWEKFLKWRIDPDVLQTNCVVMVNLNKWNTLSKENRDLLARIAIAYEKESRDGLIADAKKEWEVQKKAGVQIIELKGADRAKHLDLARQSYWKRLETELPNDYAELKRRFYQ
jgi:TRAP-type C4-dicarboxylate transport system substrate-binding protein